MHFPIDATHDFDLSSWVDSANEPNNPFPIQNLPFCRFIAGTTGDDAVPRIGVGIGEQILDLRAVSKGGLLSSELQVPASHTDLSLLLKLSLDDRQKLRQTLSHLLSDGDSALARDVELRGRAFFAQADVRFLLPHQIGNYSDFYASVFHATNVGSMFRPDNPLLPNYKHIPIGYHGRASSIVVSDTDVIRPCGQLPPLAENSAPSFGPSQNLDYELELGFVIGLGNALGSPISLADAESHLFGVTLLNDWSARDLQRWEYQPLGPFLAKSFATTIAPWIVTMEALAPFRIPAMQRPAGDPRPLPYLTDTTNEMSGGFEVELTVELTSVEMSKAQLPAQKLSTGTFAGMYWTAAQMLTHHASNGCNLQTGDIIASGTISGPERSSRGCLLELTWDGEYGKPVPGTQRTPIVLSSGEKRVFLADGDEVTIRGISRRAGVRSIGFGSCRGKVLPARVNSNE